MSDDELLLVYSTFSSKEQAESLGRVLVERMITCQLNYH